jgi:hypothetical protein
MTGIDMSKKLLSFVLNPQKLEGLNNIALKEIVVEYAPMYKKLHMMLDGPRAVNFFVFFDICLDQRIANKPELIKILKE